MKIKKRSKKKLTAEQAQKISAAFTKAAKASDAAANDVRECFPLYTVLG